MLDVNLLDWGGRVGVWQNGHRTAVVGAIALLWQGYSK